MTLTAAGQLLLTGPQAWFGKSNRFATIFNGSESLPVTWCSVRSYSQLRVVGTLRSSHRRRTSQFHFALSKAMAVIWWNGCIAVK